MFKILFYTLAVLIVFAAITLWRANAREAAAEAAYPPEGQFIDVDGTKVHAVVRGSGPDLILIHGASGSTRDVTFSLIEKLEKEFRVIAFDRPGLGYTDRITKDGETLTQQADLLAAAARKLGAVNPIVVGHSFGGAVALNWAVNHPDTMAALVLLAAPSNPWTTPIDPLYRATSSKFGATFLVPLLTAFVPNSYVANAFSEVFEPQDAPEGYAEYFGPGITLRRDTMISNARQRTHLLPDVQAMVPRYDEIAVPTEILHGNVDTIVGLSIHSALLVNQIKEAKLTVLEGIGHMPQHASEPRVIDAIQRAAARAGLR